LLQAVDNLDSL